MRHSSSFQNMSNKALKTKQITKNIVFKASNFSTYFSLFLANSRGKDKLLSLFQYLFEFICICGKHSNIQEHKKAYLEKKIAFMIISYNLKQNISSARKVFRLFRFFDEIKGLTKMLRSQKPLAYKILSTVTYLCSCFYYITDNTLWMIGILVASGVADKTMRRLWKRKKNSFSLFRVIAYLIILLYSVILQNQDISFYQSQILKSDDSTYIGKKLIEGRRKTRFFYLEICLSVLRFLMLIKSLRLKGHQKFDPVFVGLCGLFSSILGFLKALYQKKIVINVDKPAQAKYKQISLSKIEEIKLL